MERSELIKLFDGLRVSDICDAMDMAGLMDRGLLSSEIKTLFRDVDKFTHRFCGLALTVRYVPTNREVPNMDPEEFRDYITKWRDEISPGFYNDIQEGDVIVIDAAGMDVGFIGSGNSLGWKIKGAVGVVTNGGARDTDELVKQGWPVYCQYISRSFKPGRLELDKLNVPVNCGGALVRPGDVVIGDGDGVICVPVEKAELVAKLARRELDEDKISRRNCYEELGMELDETVE